MTRTLTRLLLAAALAAPLVAAPAVAGAGQSVNDRADHEATVRVVYDVFNSGNVDALDAVMAEDFVDHQPVPGQRPGRDGFKEIVLGFRAVFPDLRMTNEEIFVDGDTVVVRSTVRGTHRGPFLGSEAVSESTSHFLGAAAGCETSSALCGSGSAFERGELRGVAGVARRPYRQAQPGDAPSVRRQPAPTR